MRKIILSAIAVAATTQVQTAYALNFDFTFTGNGGDVVTGEVFGLINGTYSSATDIVVTSGFPLGGGQSYPIDMFAGANVIVRNSFSVTGSAVTYANFRGHKLLSSIGTVSRNAWLSLHTFGYNWLSTYGTAGGTSFRVTTGNRGQNLVTFTLVEAPEPASIALLGAGLAGIAGFRRRKAA